MALLKAEQRQETGSRKARALRKGGLIPAIIYGHGKETLSITVQEHDVKLAVLHGERLLEIELGGKKQNVLIKDLQYDTFGQEILHMDLTRVNLDELVELSVPIVLRGTPAGLSEDGVLQQAANEVMLKCKVRDIPEEIVVQVNDMNVGDSLYLRDLPLSEGVELLDDADSMVCSVNIVLEEEPVEAVEEGAEGVDEPEVIGEKKEPDEEQEEEK